jgi:putative addiction module component (TIGR02574 family)
MNTVDAVSTILTLSKSDRLRVAQEIIESVASEDEEVSEAERLHLQRAIAAADANPGAGRSWEEVEADMTAREQR